MFFKLDRNEDPAFTFRTMIVQAQWPGASLDETLLQVTERIERTLQETPNIDTLRSYTSAGVTTIFVDLKGSTLSAIVPDMWYEVRKRVGDMRQTLPAGVIGPGFNDDFGDTFGIIYAFTADGFTHRELRDHVEAARSPVLRVSDAFKTEQDILAVNFVADGRIIRLGDIATVRRAYTDPPQPMFRVNGRPAIGLAVATRDSGDILALGRNITAEMARISLGALIIALTLLVDDAMTTVDAMMRRLAAGDSKPQAATFAYKSLAAPMLTGTLVTIAGFVPIGFAASSAGEYTFLIFAVVAICLIVSWFVAVLFAPLLGRAILKAPNLLAPGAAPPGPGFLERNYTKLLVAAMRA